MKTRSAISILFLLTFLLSFTSDFTFGEDYLEINAEPSTHVLLVHTRLVPDNSGSKAEIPVIEKLIIQQGQVNIRKGYTVSDDKQGEYLIELLDQAGKSVFSMNYHYPRIITVPPLPEGEVDYTEPDQIWIEEPETTLVLPYFPEVFSVRISSPGRLTVTQMSMKKALLYDIIKKPSPVPAQPGKFHILIIASNYTSSNMSAFNSQAQNVKNWLLSREPFSSYSSDVEVHIYGNTASLGCYCGCYSIARLMCCDVTSLISAAAASGYYYDEVIVIHNANIYCGGGYRDYGTYQTNSYDTYAMLDDDDSWSSGMAGHEFGHSFGNLCDEYTYTSEGYSYYECVNCKPDCSGWSYLTSACNMGCDAKSNYYRPDDSIMLTGYNTDTYNSVSIQHSLIPRLQYFLLATTTVPVTTTIPSTSSSTTTSIGPSTTTSIGPSTTTTMSHVTNYEAMWGDEKDEYLLILRAFRDEVLMKDETGRNHIFLLYSNSLEVLKLFIQNPSLPEETREVIDELMPEIQSLLDEGKMVISEDQLADFVSLLTRIETKASPRFKTAIRKVKKDIKKGEIFGRLGIKIAE